MSPRVRFLFACVLGLGSAGLLAANSEEVKLGPEEILKAASRRRGEYSSSWLFWSALALVVGGLLFVLTRLLPKSSEREG